MKCCGCNRNIIYNEYENDIYDWIEDNVLEPLRERTKRKRAFSSGFLLMMGILLEDIPQLVVTFLIEDKIKSDDPRGDISSTAVVNLNFAIFDICHKMAQTIDLRSDVLNPAYAVMRTIKAHEDWITSLVVASANQLLSTSYDGTAKLWDSASGRCKEIFKCYSIVRDAVVMEDSKLITACDDYCLRIFNMTTGDLEKTITLGYTPRFVSLSPNGRSIFTNGGNRGRIQRWDDVSSEECSFEYKWSADSLSFLDNDTFVSFTGDMIHLGNIHKQQPIQTKYLLEYERGIFVERNKRMRSVWYGDTIYSCIVMSTTMFLVGDGFGRVHQYVFSEDELTCNSTIKVSNETIVSLTKVNESLFVASDNNNAKLYNVANMSSPIFVFKGHGSSIYSSVFLEGQKAIATGDKDGKIKIWSIEKHLENDTQDTSLNTNHHDDNDEDATVDVVNVTQNTDNNNNDNNEDPNIDVPEP